MNFNPNDFNNHYQIQRFQNQQNRQNNFQMQSGKVNSPNKNNDKGNDDLGSWRNN